MLFEVIAKCGHVGRKKCILVSFAVKAYSGKEAARKVRRYSRVKHDHKDAIKAVYKIPYERYVEIQYENENDPYLKCRNIQEQNKLDLSDRIVDDETNIKTNKQTRNIEYKLKKRIEFEYSINKYYKECLAS